MEERCPNCNNKLTFGLDEWGHTPFHLHCDNCGIIIGATSLGKCFELFKKYHEPNTYIEFYHNKIQMSNKKALLDI